MHPSANVDFAAQEAFVECSGVALFVHYFYGHRRTVRAFASVDSAEAALA
jgi:hypothetical protein